MNNSKNRILIFLVIFLLLTNIAMLLYFTAFNKMSKAGHPDRHGPGITAFLQNEAGFSKDQMIMLDSLKKQHRTAIKPLFDDLGTSKDHFYQLLGKPGIADSVLQAAADDIGKKQAALDLQFFQNFMSIRKLCTEQQLPKFDSVMPNLASKMMQPWLKNNFSRRRDSTQSKN
jgi:periplasmic protein CpxP/Spy